MIVTQHLREGELDEQLAKAEEVRDPPVPVIVLLPMDQVEYEAELHGWATNPNGAEDGLRGLVFLTREYSTGYGAELLIWVRADRIRLR